MTPSACRRKADAGWTRPEVGELKCNVGAADFAAEAAMSWGAVLRDEYGQNCGCCVGHVAGVYAPHIAEAVASVRHNHGSKLDS